MPPHLFHALSDDPARWERQFGCMAALFQMFEHHPRFLRKRTRSPTTSSASPASHPPTISKTSNKRSAPSAKAPRSSKDGHNYVETAHAKACASFAKKGSSERAPNYKTTSDILAANRKSKRRFKNESPSILDSSRATGTIREPPRKSFERPTSPDQCCTTSTTPATSRSLPGSPQVQFSKLRDAGSHQVIKSLFDKPRVSLDGKQAQLAVPRHFIHRDQSCDGLCTDPVKDLQESIRALAKLQQATQQFVDGFEAQQHLQVQAGADEPAKKSSSRSSRNWWNARKNRLFQSSHNHASQKSILNSMEAAAARTSSFDYTEAIRISQKIQETPARLSLDGRELVPKAVMKLREAMRLGVMNTEPLKCSSSMSADQKKEHSLCLRSALSKKEEFNFVKGRDYGRPACNPSVCLADGGQRFNVIARLMGLDDLPVTRQAAVNGDGHAKLESKPPFREPRLLKDLLRCPRRMDIDQTDVNSLPAHYSADDCMNEKQIRQYDAAMASKLSKIEAASATVNNTAHAPAYLQGAARVLKREDDCKVISEVEIQRGKPNKQCNLNYPSNLGPDSVVLSKHALEVTPSSSLVMSKRAAASNDEGRGKTDHSDTEAHKVVYCVNDQDAVTGSQSELEKRKGRPEQEPKASLVDRRMTTLQQIVDGMHLKGRFLNMHAQIQGNQLVDYGNPMKMGETNSRIADHATRVDPNRKILAGEDQTVMQPAVPVIQPEVSKLSEGICTIVVMQPRIMRTLSMETHFPFDVPTVENEHAALLSLGSSDRPKLQAAAATEDIKADATSSASDYRMTCTRQWDMANRKFAHKRKGAYGHQEEVAGVGIKCSSPPTSKLFQDGRKGAVKDVNDDEPKLITKEAAASMTPKTACVRYRNLKQHPAEAKPGTGKDKNIQNGQAAACGDSYCKMKADFRERRSKVGGEASLCNRKDRSLDKSKRSGRNFCELYAESSTTPKAAGAGSEVNQRRQLRRTLVGRSMSVRTGVVRADPLESAQRLSSHSHGPCTTNKEGTSRRRGGVGGHAPSMEKCCNDSRNCVSQDTESYVLDTQTAEQIGTSVGCNAPSNLCTGSAPASTKLTTRGETGVDLRPISVSEHPHVDNGDAELLRVGEELGLLNAQFEYVEAILERAGLLADKEDVVERHLGERATINPAIFLEIERSTWTSPAADNAVKVKGRQRRRLIFDCVNEILAGHTLDARDGFQRGLLLDVWKELRRLMVMPPLTLPSSTTSAPTSTKRVSHCWLLAGDYDLEQHSQSACWTCSSAPPLSFSHHVSMSLEDDIFQDLLLEFIASNSTL